jgi:hypothetical protein
MLNQAVHIVTNRLERVMKEDNLSTKHQSMFSADKSGIQLLNNPTKFIAKKRAKYMNVVGPREKREKGKMTA